jgi:nitrite reductase/ring-hydroxylating ferredoxin subunit
LTGVAGWLGGHLAYAMGVGVDTTAFQHLPTEWTDVCSERDVRDEPSMYFVAGVPVVVYRVDGRTVALADRCTHRGGPLHEGQVSGDGCITCPWHGSRFDASGRVRSGPATRPQPTLHVRTRGGRLEVRRDEHRTLRLNPIGL